MKQQIEDTLSNLLRANSSLHKAIEATPRSDLIVSAIIKNFEFNFELSWKAMRRLLLHHGVSSASPRQAIAESFRKEFINNETTWLSMIEDRNLTVHTYDEAFAREMTDRISRLYLTEFDAFLSRLQLEVAAL